ncbi:MAG: SdrD B-like domain-containing protein [Anaerolineae bacterium]
MRRFALFIILMLSACNLASGEPTTPVPLENANATVQLIEQATSTPNALPTATPLTRPIPLSQTIMGIVWHDVCDVSASETADVPLGCIETNGDFAANGILEVGETGIAGVTVTLGEGACPSDGLAETLTDTDGTYTFRDLSSETYCVSINTLRPENLTLLSPGMDSAEC